MELNDIEELLKKYDSAETSLAEEAQIRAFFDQPNVPAHLEPYKMLFQYVRLSKTEEFSKTLTLQPRRSRKYQWIAVAAIAILMLGAYMQVDRMNQKATLEDLNQDQLMAYHQTLEVFSLVSAKFNTGTDNLKAIGLVSEKLNEGAESLTYLKEFNETTDKIIKTK